MELYPELLDRSSHVPLYAQLETILSGWIEAGWLNPGDQVPSEIELADKLGLSRMTARHALDIMVANGQLYRRAGSGTFVAGPKPPYLGLTHSLSSELGELGYEVHSELLGLEIIPAPPRAVAELQLPPERASRVVRLRRLRYVQDEPVSVGRAFLDSRYAAALRKQDYVTTSFLEIVRRVTGLAIVGSRTSVEAVMARHDEADVLHVREGSPLLLMRGTAYAIGMVPVYYASTVFRGDRIRVLLEEGITAGQSRVQPIGNPPAPTP